MRLINVLHLRSSQGIYGAEKVILGLAKWSKNTNHYIGCLLKERKGYGYKFLNEVRRCGLQGCEINSSHNIWDIGAVKQIRDILKNDRIDIIHTHDFLTDILGFMSSRIPSIPLITTEHGRISDSRLWLCLCKKIDEVIVSRYFDHIVYVAEDMIRSLNKNEQKNISVIPNGIDTTIFTNLSSTDHTEIKKGLGISSNAKVIGSIGRLSPEKGFDYLLRAFQNVLLTTDKDMVLLIIGEGVERDALTKLAIELGISSRVIFTGFRDNIHELMYVMDIYVSSSLTEGFPISLLEALAAERPVIATSVGDVPKIIMNGETGLSISPGNVNEIADAILILLEDSNLAGRLGKKGSELISAFYSIDKMVSKYEEIYLEVIRRKK